MTQGVKEIFIQNVKYSNLEIINKGGFGTVYKAVHNEKEYAIKELQNNKDNDYEQKSLTTELNFIKEQIERLDENLPIVKIFGFEIKENNLYYVMEKGIKSLEDYFKELWVKENPQVLYLLQRFWIIYAYILKAILFFESEGKAHRDIKPCNFLLFEESNNWGFNIKLIDFGTVKVFGERFQTKTESPGTIPYMAPESFEQISSKNFDIWSLGIIIYYLLYKKLPPHALNIEKTKEFASSNEEIKFPNLNGNYQSLQQIAKYCLIKEQIKRPSAFQLYDYTKQNFFFDELDIIIPENYIKELTEKMNESGKRKKVFIIQFIRTASAKLI